ncbi:MAG TPA: hypothetical protein VMS86_08580 [Thermoanaerobaculia bacterium]|nr:hypothetical protein [Thermoanaerobaculia bacterium]
MSELPVTPSGAPRVLYCNCTYAKVVPESVKREVLARLSASGVAFDAVADLCELSARKDAALERLAAAGPIRIAACYPRAVKWLFHAAGASLPETGVEVLNMREQPADEIARRLIPDAAPADEAKR